MSHSRDQSQKENRKSSISKSFHEDETIHNAQFFSSLLEGTDGTRFIWGVLVGYNMRGKESTAVLAATAPFLVIG
jgi:hypothetical protein